MQNVQKCSKIIMRIAADLAMVFKNNIRAYNLCIIMVHKPGNSILLLLSEDPTSLIVHLSEDEGKT